MDHKLRLRTSIPVQAVAVVGILKRSSKMLQERTTTRLVPAVQEVVLEPTVTLEEPLASAQMRPPARVRC